MLNNQNKLLLVDGFSLVDGQILDAQGNVIPDAPYTVLPLSVRSFNVLSREQQRIKDPSHAKLMISDLLCLSREDLGAMRNMGVASVNEVVREVGRYLVSSDDFDVSQLEMEQDPVFVPGYEVIDQAIRNRKTGSVIDDVDLKTLDISYWNLKKIHDAGYAMISDLVGLKIKAFRERTGLGKKVVRDVEELLLDYLENNAVNYGQPETAKVIITPEKILSFLGEYEFQGVTMEMLTARFPEADVQTIEDVLDPLWVIDEITYEGDLIRKTHRSFFQYAFTAAKTEKKKLTDRHLEVLRWRAKDVSLEEIGQSMGLTRERVRQIEKKAFAILTDDGKELFSEDALAELYKNYAVNRNLFISGLKQLPQTWYYISYRYDAGTRDPQEALEDPAISVKDRYLLEQYLHREDIFVRNRWVRKTRGDIEDYLAEEYCQDEKHIDDFLALYKQFVTEHGLADDEDLKPDVSLRQTRINRLMRSDNILWKQDMMLRYYDIHGEDFTELLETLNLPGYQNIEISTLKWISEYPELMSQYDIRDQYELHNILRKIHAEKLNDTMKFGRMPSIVFGVFDRDEAVKEVMFALAPVSIDDLVEMLHLEYGIAKDTIKANWLSGISEYYDHGIYSVDYQDMPDDQMAAMKAALIEDFYNFTELRQLYLNTVSDPDLSLLSSYNLKRLGFIVGTGYIVQNWPTADAYFDHLLMDTDKVDMSETYKRFWNIQSFDSCLSCHRDNMDILEYEPHKYINIRLLEKSGFDRERLKAYGNRVYDFVTALKKENQKSQALLLNQAKKDAYFSIHSLRVAGFVDEIDMLGLGDLFCASILKQDKRFSWQRIGGAPVFNLGKTFFDTRDFLRAYIVEAGSISVSELADQLVKRFDIVMKREKILEKARVDETYYDPVMDKFYTGYAVFEGENSTLLCSLDSPESKQGEGTDDGLSMLYWVE